MTARLRLVALDELQLDGQRHVVAERLAAAGERGVPVDAVVGAVDDRVELDRDAILAVEVLRRAGDRAGRVERLGDAAQRELAGHAAGADVGGAEADLRVALGVEEVRALEVAGELVDGDVDARNLDRAGEDPVLERGVDLLEGTTERRDAGVLDREGGLAVDRVEGPGAGRNDLLIGGDAHVQSSTSPGTNARDG